MEKSPKVVIFLVILLFVEGLQLCFCQNSTVGCIESERKALLQLKQSFNDTSKRLVSWNASDCCRWNGVSCDQHTGHVVKLDLRAPVYSSFFIFDRDEWNPIFDFEALSATEVNVFLVELKRLEYLDLSGNNFNQIPVPSFIGSFKNLRYLNLSSAGFAGRIPVQLGNLTSLQILDLSQKTLWDYSRGLYADSFQWISYLSSLEKLDMSFVNINKALDAVQVLNTLPSLICLRLNGCGLQNIHFSPGKLNSTFLTRVQYLGLRENSLNGPLPNALQNMTALRELDLAANYLNSTVPLWLANPKSLVYLNLRGNEFENIEGGVFSMLNKACSLKSLDLSRNSILGEVLGSKTNSPRCLLYDLEYLDLSHNGISGNLPENLGKLKSLVALDLSKNSFYGPIPSSLGELSTLKSLSLFHNQLNGDIPQSLGRLLTLKVLDVSHNQLTGIIPQSLWTLSALENLILSYNCLNGTIPQSLGRLSALKELDLSNNQLNGIIPQSLGRLSMLEYLDLSYNQLIGYVPNSLGQLVNLWGLDISSNSLQGVVSELAFFNLPNLSTLDISSNHLTCKFKHDWVPPFRYLRYVNMSSCDFGSQFPHWIQTQKNVYVLDLSNANISGGFPIWVHRISLSHLDLSTNKINGSLPTKIADIMPELKTLLLGNNSMKGELPKSFCKLESLEVMDLSRNELSGEMPRCWRDTQMLYVINLSYNKLSGTIPKSIGNLLYLKRLHVDQNNLTGVLPLALKNCKELELLDLGENSLFGSIPTRIGESLSSLQILRLRKNMLNGSIPSQLCQLSKLQILNLANNDLSGRIPHCFGSLTGMILEKALVPTSEPAAAPSISEPPVSPPSPVDDDTNWTREKVREVTKGVDLEYTKLQLKLLDFIDLSSNKLVGVIPEELCLLSGLRGLNLSHNHLSGNIPNKIGELKLLESLDLSNNNLSGSIPPSMSALPSISHLNLSHNNLSGKIPTSNQLQTLDDLSIYAGNLQLCGKPLPTKCPGDDSSVQPPISIGHEDNDSEEEEKEKILFYFFVLAGYATGLWGVIGTFVFKRSWRVAYFHFVDNTKERIPVMVAMLKKRMQRTNTEE